MPASNPHDPAGERLNKVLARAGIASRRGADDLIREGRVVVNGTAVTDLGMRVDCARDAIKVDGRRVGRAPSVPVFYLMNKPRGCVTTMSDPEGRATVKELLKGVRKGVFPVGRLDYQTDGLLLFTDDGELARKLMHPSTEVSRTYLAKVRGRPVTATLARLRRGVILDGKPTGPMEVRITTGGENVWCQVTVKEGRKHLVRNLFLSVGHPVVKLRRISYGGVSLGDLPLGAIRSLTDAEVARLREAASDTLRTSVSPKRRSPRN